MKNIFKNKTVVGIAAIFLGIVVCFVLTPVYNSSIEEKVKIVRVIKEVEAGEAIPTDAVAEVEVSRYHLPDTVIFSKEEVTGKYTRIKLYKDDCILKSKLSDQPIGRDDYLNDLDGEKNAISITLPSFAAGLSNKLQRGDIVSVIVTEGDSTTIPAELKYVKLLASTTEEGKDTKEESGDAELEEKKIAVTVTLLVNDVQANELAYSEQNNKMHLALVYRGTEENCNKFLTAQEEVIQDIKKEQTPSAPANPTPEKEGELSGKEDKIDSEQDGVTSNE